MAGLNTWIEGKEPGIGDYVWLKSGSPRMTIVDFPHPTQVTVSWVNELDVVVEIDLPRIVLSRFPH